MSKSREKRGLGRGLSALMGDIETKSVSASSQSQEAGQGSRPETHVPIENVIANPDQPRRNFNQKDLDELAVSVKEKGILQPLIVRPNPGGDGTYQIVAGERRWRAAQLARLHEVPVLIRDLTDAEVLEIAIIENVQRADLNPVEEAQGFQQLMQTFAYTQDQLSKVLGKSRSHIANILRLLRLPEDVLNHLRSGALSIGHARALIPVDNPSVLAATVVQKSLSVRETERLAKQGSASEQGHRPKQTSKPPTKDADTRVLEDDLTAHLGLKVSIDHKPGQSSGSIKVSYKTLEQLDGLCRLLSSPDKPV